MYNFVYQNPTKIIFGRGTISSIGGETAVFAKKALLLYGRGSIKQNTVYRQVTESLAGAGVTIIEHGGVRSNPVLSHVRQGIEIAKAEKVEAVVAVGGGSVIDSGKAIAAGAAVEHDVWKFMTGKKSVTGSLPLTCVLTLAASGSEMNSGLVLTNEETRQKFGFANRLLFPRVSILDPTATFSVSPAYTAYGAVDAMAHVLEFYFTHKEVYAPVQERLMEGLLLNNMESCERVLANPFDYQARADAMWAATLSLNGLTAAGLGKVGFPMHLIEHSLSALYDVPHGAGLSVVIPGWMRYQATRQPARFARFGKRIFQVDQGDEAEMAAGGIKRLKNWFTKVGSPVNLTEIGVSMADIPEIAANALPLAKIWRMNDYNQEKIEEILRLCI